MQAAWGLKINGVAKTVHSDLRHNPWGHLTCLGMASTAPQPSSKSLDQMSWLLSLWEKTLSSPATSPLYEC